jgi:hypothetical protein
MKVKMISKVNLKDTNGNPLQSELLDMNAQMESCLAAIYADKKEAIEI